MPHGAARQRRIGPGRASVFTVMGLLLLGSCRGDLSSEPPIHLNPNMDNQARFDPQEGSAHFEDGRAMRPQVPGTVARGELRADNHENRGRLTDGTVARGLPPSVKLDRDLLLRGQERYGIYCTPCHGGAGMGDGIVVKRGLVPPPSLHEARVRAMAVGELFQVISDGVRNMPAYGPQIPVRDRWAIVAYLRALQAGRTASLEQVPKDIADEKGWKP